MSNTPSTLASKAEQQFQTILATHFDKATKAKAAYRDQVKQIHANEMTSSKAKELEQEEARTELLGQLEAIKSKPLLSCSSTTPTCTVAVSLRMQAACAYAVMQSRLLVL